MSDLPPKPTPHDPPPLQRLPKPHPIPAARPTPPEPAAGSGSATGFVSMLARQQFPESLESVARRSKDQLRMAREIQPVPSPDAPAAPTTGRVPHWYGPAAAAAATLAAVLTLIGIWAVGALIYMHQVSPLSARQVRYPFVRWSLDAGPMGGYTPTSRMMAGAMLLCIPVAALLVLMAILLRRQIAAAKSGQS